MSRQKSERTLQRSSIFGAGAKESTRVEMAKFGNPVSWRGLALVEARLLKAILGGGRCICWIGRYSDGYSVTALTRIA